MCSDPAAWYQLSEPCKPTTFFIHCKFTLSDHLFSNYVPVPASRKLSALVMWTRSWVCNQGQCLMLGTFSYPLKDEGRVNYYPAELIGFCRGWFRLLHACDGIAPPHTKTHSYHLYIKKLKARVGNEWLQADRSTSGVHMEQGLIFNLCFTFISFHVVFFWLKK